MTETLRFLKAAIDARMARKEAEEDYDRFFAEFHSYIQYSRHSVIREIFAPAGMVGYAIQVDIDAPADILIIMKAWIEAFNHGQPAITYDDAIEHVKDLANRYKLEHGEFPAHLTVDALTWHALHGTGHTSVKIPMMHLPGNGRNAQTPKSFSLIQVTQA